MMDLRKKIFIMIGISAGLVIALILLYLFVFKNNQTTVAQPIIDTVASTDNLTNEIIQNNQQTVVETPVKPANPDELYAKQVARIFVERFNTYSNQNDSGNVNDVLDMTTSKMQKWLLTQGQKPSNDYAGVTTRVIASKVVKIDATSAVVSVDTQQVKETTNTQETSQRSGTVNLIKQDNDWKVDGWFWEK